jgi:lipid-A-disaccharide synthase
VGITEILGHLPTIYGRYRHLIAEADKRKPDLAVVIDSPAFNWRVARQMKKRGIPVVYYVAPQFWAWRQGRVRLLRDYVDKALVIFPFEEKFYRDRGVDAAFVGHPLAELSEPAISRLEYAAQFGLDPAKHWITLMPGSRVKEVGMNLPTMLETAGELGAAYEFLLPVAPTLDLGFLKSFVGGRRIALVPESLPALWHSRAGIIASGTATVEAAMMRTPFVMVYRVSRLTYLLGKPRVKVPRFAMVNLIAGEEVVPELVQGNFTAANVVARMGEILAEGPVRARMLEGLGRVKERLRAPDRGEEATRENTRSPAERAAAIIWSMARRS